MTDSCVIIGVHEVRSYGILDAVSGSVDSISLFFRYAINCNTIFFHHAFITSWMYRPLADLN